MVVPTLAANDPAADGSRWASMRTSLPDVWLKRIWLLWIFGASLSACFSAFIVLFICMRRRLRSNIVNQFVVGLAISDFLFSFLCTITCALHYTHGHWYGGEWMCVVQALYCVYGFAASIWMNVLIAHELHRMAACPLQLKSYRPLPGREVRRRILIVHVSAVLFSTLSFIPGLPTDVGAFSGLACLPMEYDVASTIWHWLVTMNLMLVVPMLALTYYFGRVYLLVFRQPDADAKDRAVVKFFFILLAVFVGMWMNTGVLVWVVRVDGMGVLDGLGGFVSHLQGFVSATIYVAKTDVSEELRYCCARLCGSSKHDSVRAFTDRALQRERTQQVSVSSGSSVAVSSETLGAMVKELGVQARFKLLSYEQVPLRVVALATWLDAGHFPRSNEDLTRPYEESDVVIFISHRWWGDQEPDDDKNSKYGILCRGIQALVSVHRLKPEDVVIWADWCCIEQDDMKVQQQGIASLITYAARSNFVLIPVADEAVAIQAAQVAKHPNFLWNYGERAWCRLEVYIYSCAAEVAGRPACIYSFSPRSPGLRNRLGLRSEKLRRLQGTFDALKMPSEGLLSHEEDRALVKSVETEMRGIYVRNAILKEQLQVLGGRSSQCTFRLTERQLECAHMPMLVKALLDVSVAKRLRAVILDGNLLSDDSVALLMQQVVCSPLTPQLTKLSLSNNPRLGADGVRAVALGLTEEDCCLETLSLGSCGLEGDDVKPLVACLPSAPLRYLDLSHNRLDDSAVAELLLAVGGYDRPSTALDVEGNRISVRVFLQVARAGRALELGRASVLTRATWTSADGQETDVEQGFASADSDSSRMAIVPTESHSKPPQGNAGPPASPSLTICRTGGSPPNNATKPDKDAAANDTSRCPTSPTADRPQAIVPEDSHSRPAAGQPALPARRRLLMSF